MHDYTQPDFVRSALLTVDTQNDFTLPGAPAEIKGTIDVVPYMARLVAAYRKSELPIVHVVRLYLPDGSNADLCRRSPIEEGKAVVVPGTEGAELVADLKPSSSTRLHHSALLGGEVQEIGRNETIMYKPRWGAFFHTPLEEHLRTLDVNTLVVSGCNFPNCPRASIFEASERDYRVVLVSDAVSQLYERGRTEIEGIGVRILSTGEVENAVI